MGFFHNRRIQKAVKKAFGEIRDGVTAFPSLEELGSEDRVDAWVKLAGMLLDDPKQKNQALVRDLLERSLSAAPGDIDALLTLADLEIEENRPECAARIYRRILTMHPDRQKISLALAILLLQMNRVEEALKILDGISMVLSIEESLRLGEALFGADEVERAVEVLGSGLEECRSQMKSTFDNNLLYELYQEISAVHDEAYAELHGREAVVAAYAEGHDLDTGAGVNYALAGRLRMTGSDRIAVKLELEPPEESERTGLALIEEGRASLGLTHRGCSLLRKGKAQKAEKLFRKACNADEGNFAAYLGLGASLDAQKYRFFAKLKTLPNMPVSPLLSRVVPDYDALTETEKRVVRASIHPLRAGLYLLWARNAVIRILPLDVRSTDLPELERYTGQRTDDHRVYEAIDGLATARMAIASITDLMDVESPGGWVFAHEFAHMVFFYLDDRRRSELHKLRRLAIETGCLFCAYFSKNPDEFFAGAYQEYLRFRYGCTTYMLYDEQGVLAEIFSYFDDLAELNRFT